MSLPSKMMTFRIEAHNIYFYNFINRLNIYSKIELYYIKNIQKVKGTQNEHLYYYLLLV